MKKFGAILACVLVLAMTFAMTVSAGPEGIIENDPITVAYGTPSIDGTINNDEGWSTSALMNAETLGYYWAQNPLTSDGNVKFAWDDNNFYFSANIIEGLQAVHAITGEIIEAGTNEFIYSTGEDDIDVDDAGQPIYGYNGDIFGLMIDPLDQFIEYGYTGNEDYTPWYLVGLHEGDVAKMYRQKINAGDITEQVKVAGKKTAEGWCFEAAIPWDIIIKDISDITYGDIELDKTQLLANGATVKASGMYQDRFNDPEAGEVATWGRYVTAPTTLPDGNPGHLGTGDHAMSCGIVLTLSKDDNGSVDSGSDTTVPTTDDNGSNEDTEVVTDEQGNAVTDASGNKVTQKVDKTTTKKATTGTSTGGNAAQTFDIGIAVALGALATSGIGFVAAKKRK